MPDRRTRPPTPVPDARGVRPPRAARGAGRGDARQAVRCSSTTRPGRARRPRARPGARRTALQARRRRRWGTTSPSGCRPGPDVLRAWFGTNAAGAVYAPLNLAARGSYLEHTLNIAESKVLVAHREPRRSSRRPRPAAPRDGRPRRRRRRRRAPLADDHAGASSSTARARSARCCRGPSSPGTTSA